MGVERSGGGAAADDRGSEPTGSSSSIRIFEDPATTYRRYLECDLSSMETLPNSHTLEAALVCRSFAWSELYEAQPTVQGYSSV